MFGDPFYHKSIRSMVAVFGTIFNDIKVVKRDGTNKVLSSARVPLAYGPRQKFLARIEAAPSLGDPNIGIKLPRMSFEITSLTYDTNTKLSKNTVQRVTSATANSRDKYIGPVPYRMGFQLNIITKNQDEALQILEQILPFFQPEYSVTIKETESNFKHDVPITLTSVSLADDYEGDFASRRAIIYTLDFETRVRFYGPKSTSGFIRTVISDFVDADTLANIEKITPTTDPANAQPGDTFTVTNTFTFPDVQDFQQLVLSTSGVATFTANEPVSGSITGAAATFDSQTDTTASGTTIKVRSPDSSYIVGEVITGGTSGAFGTITSVTDLPA